MPCACMGPFDCLCFTEFCSSIHSEDPQLTIPSSWDALVITLVYDLFDDEFQVIARAILS